MKGFVNPTNHSVFDDFIEYLGDAMPGCRPYRYGSRRGETAPNNSRNAGRANRDQGSGNLIVEPVQFGLELHRPDFYDLSFNPDDRLISRLVDDENSALSVVVTDGVYSEPEGATSPPVVQAIQGWMEKGGVFGIFVLRSAFNGDFYSERGRTMIPKRSVPARPFYAFVFSPTENGLRDLQEKFRRRFPEMQTLIFTDSAVSCLPDLNTRLKGTYSYKRPPDVSYYWHMFNSELFDKHNPAPVGYNLKCSVAPDYPVSEFKVDVTPKYYRWSNGRFGEIEGVPPGFATEFQPNQVVSESGGGNINGPAGNHPDFIVYFPRDQGGDYGFYHLQLTMSPKELRPEIKSLSTRDDRQPQDEDKTYRFFELISSLSEAHFKSRLMGRTTSAIFVTIQNH